jgi:hypothetical protein
MASASLTIAACGNVTELSVGNTPVVDGGSDSALVSASPDAMSSTTLLDRLEAKCAAPAGQIDEYTSAAELTTRLAGRWYHCGSLGNWGLPRGTGLEFDFGSVGTYAFLSYSDATQTFTPSSDPDQSGQALYFVSTGVAQPDGGGDGGFDAAGVPEGGAGGAMFVPVDDTTARNGLFVILTRADVDNLQFQMQLEKNPPRLHTNELGATPAFATWVRIDP